MAYRNIVYEKKGRIAYVTINRPQALNAVDPDTSEELSWAWSDFRDDPEVWVGILTGTGERAFCAGADIKWMAEHRDDPAAPERRQFLGWSFGGICDMELWKPIIGAINGWCLGGGLEMALACDILIAAEHAQFGLPEVRNVGGPPGSGGPIRLPRQVPLKIAMQMLLTGLPISAQEAHRVGLVNKVVPLSELMNEANKMAEAILECMPHGVRGSKELALRSWDERLYGGGLRAWDCYRPIREVIAKTEDSRSGEGPRSFVEKRRARWTGR